MRKITNDELGRLTIEQFDEAQKTPIVVVADNIRSLNNIGSLFRTADAFAIEKIVLCGITATPPNKEIHKTALGAELTVKWEYESDSCNAVHRLKEEGYIICAAEQVQGAVMLDELTVDCTKKYVVVLGNEVNGVQQEVVDLCDLSIEIPQFGTKHSLNVSVAGGVILWQMSLAYKI